MCVYVWCLSNWWRQKPFNVLLQPLDIYVFEDDIRFEILISECEPISRRWKTSRRMSWDFPHNQASIVRFEGGNGGAGVNGQASKRLCLCVCNSNMHCTKPHYKFHVHFIRNRGHCIPFLTLHYSFPEITDPFQHSSHQNHMYNRKSGLTRIFALNKILNSMKSHSICISIWRPFQKVTDQFLIGFCAIILRNTWHLSVFNDIFSEEHQNTYGTSSEKYSEATLCNFILAVPMVERWNLDTHRAKIVSMELWA